MNNHFGDATFKNFFSRFADYVLHDLIDLSEGEFDIILRKNVFLKLKDLFIWFLFLVYNFDQQMI